MPWFLSTFNLINPDARSIPSKEESLEAFFPSRGYRSKVSKVGILPNGTSIKEVNPSNLTSVPWLNFLSEGGADKTPSSERESMLDSVAESFSSKIQNRYFHHSFFPCLGTAVLTLEIRSADLFFWEGLFWSFLALFFPSNLFWIFRLKVLRVFQTRGFVFKFLRLCLSRRPHFTIRYSKRISGDIDVPEIIRLFVFIS